MADIPSTSAAGRVIDASLDDAKNELKKSVQRVLIQNLKRRSGSADERRNQLVRVNSVGAIASVENGSRRELLSSDSQVANYLRERGYEYTLSVLMAEANVPDSNILKSIATRLNDSRSRLVAGNPEFRTAILQIWEETEKKYNEKLRQYIIDWEMKQTMQLKQMERILRRRLIEEEQEMKRKISNRLDEMEVKEKAMTDVFHERAAAFEHQVDHDKRQLLADARELDGKRQDLQSLETEFNRQVEIEQNRIRTVKESLNQLSAELKRQQLQLTFQMDEAVKEARKQEQLRYAEKLQQISRKEEKIREIIEKAKASRGQVDALKYMLTERDNKVQELEMTVQQYKSEITKIQDKLREKEDYLRRMNDYDLLKHENMRMRDEGRHVREQLSKEKLQLQQRNFELEAQCRELAARMEEWRPSEENPFRKELMQVKTDFEKAKTEWRANETHYRKQLEEETSKNDHLKSRLDDQTNRLQNLVEEVKKLQFQLAKRRVMSEGAIYDDRKTRRGEGGGAIMNFDEIEDVEEDEPTPDYLKEAKRRLRMLERESETFEDSVRRYQQKAIETSSLAVWQAQTASSALVSSYRDRNEDLEPRTSVVRWATERHPTDAYPPVASAGNEQPRSFPNASIDQSQVRLEDSRATTSWQHPQPLISQNQPPVPEQPKPAQLVQESSQDDWETKLRKREEERRRRDEDFRRQQEEELKRLQESEKQPSVAVSDKEPNPVIPQQKGEPSAPAVDPVLQKYMQMVLEQRQKEKEAPVAPETTLAVPDKPPPSAAEKTKEQEVEVGSIKEADSESDFEW